MIRKHGMMTSGCCIAFSFSFALAMMIQARIRFTGDVDQALMEDTFLSFKPGYLLMFVFVFCAALALTMLLPKLVSFCSAKHLVCYKSAPSFSREKKRLLFLIYTCAFAIIYLLYLLMNYPGFVLDDSISSLMQITHQMGYSNHHPVMYTLFVGIFVNAGYALTHDYNVGVFFYSVAQLLIIAGIQGYLLLRLRMLGVRRYALLIMYLFLTGNNLFCLYALVMWKDPLFSAFTALYIWMLYDAGRSDYALFEDRGFLLKFSFMTFLVAFFRNNGLYIAIIMSLILFFRLRKHSRRFVPYIAGSVLLILIVRYPVFSMMGVNTAHAEESVAIPMQQVALVLHEGGTISDHDEIDRILPEEIWAEEYHPFRADFIKWNESFDTSEMNSGKGRFLENWASGLKENLSLYIEAFLLETYGYWSVETRDSYSYTYTFREDNDWGLHQRDLLFENGLPDIGGPFDHRENVSAGTLVWILFLSVTLLLEQGRKNAAFAFLPAILLWCTIMVAAPVAFSLRYLLLLVYIVPLMVLLPFVND